MATIQPSGIYTDIDPCVDDVKSIMDTNLAIISTKFEEIELALEALEDPKCFTFPSGAKWCEREDQSGLDLYDSSGTIIQSWDY